MRNKIGEHTLEVQADVLKLILHGPFTLADMKLFTAIADEQLTRFGYLLVMHDVTDAKGLPAEARRYRANNLREAKLKGPVYAASTSFGVGTIARGMVALFYAILRLASSGSHSNYIAKSEADALAFLAKQRRHFEAQLKRI